MQRNQPAKVRTGDNTQLKSAPHADAAAPAARHAPSRAPGPSAPLLKCCRCPDTAPLHVVYRAFHAVLAYVRDTTDVKARMWADVVGGHLFHAHAPADSTERGHVLRQSSLQQARSSQPLPRSRSPRAVGAMKCSSRKSCSI